VFIMYNWNTTNGHLDSMEDAVIWRLNQTINFGLNGEKLDLKQVRIYWDKLTIDPKRKSFLSLLLWDKLS